MTENNKNSIKDYLNEFEETLDSNRQISLYKMLKKKCPLTIRSLEKKINGKHNILFLDRENKWYTAVINYLVKNDILEAERQENGTTLHNVSEEYKKYFVHPVSTVYAPKNCSNHLILYSQIAGDFLVKSGLVSADGSEFVQDKKKPKKNTFVSKHSKLIKIIFSIIMFVTIVNYILMVSKYGINQMTPFLCNTCLFALSILITTTKLD